MTTVYFDICDTLGTLQVSPDRGSGEMVVERIFPFPRTKEKLTLLSDLGHRLGIISNSGLKHRNAVDNALKKSGLKSFFKEDGLLVYDGDNGLERNTEKIFELAIKLSGEKNRADCFFVGDDRFERLIARQLGMGVSPHLNLANNVVNGERLRYVSITLKAPSGFDEAKTHSMLLDNAPMVLLNSAPIEPPFPNGKDKQEVIAIAAESGIAQSLSPLLEDLKLLPEQVSLRETADNISPNISDVFLVRKDPAIKSWDEDFQPKIESFRLKKMDDGVLIALPGDKHIDNYHPRNAQHGHTRKLISTDQWLNRYGLWHASRNETWLKEDTQVPSLNPEEKKVLAEIDGRKGGLIDQYLNKYAGDAESRHSLDYKGNRTAVDQLVRDFQQLGDDKFRIRLYAFKMEWRLLFNVEAELKGETDEVVITSAHLDSTAQFTHEGTNRTAPAPGADDDASGVAAVLAIAGAMKKLSGKESPHRTIRFLLFNAEEQGLIGSQKYANYQRGRKVEIMGVFQMDMIGYNKDKIPSWELHAGCLPFSDVQLRSEQLTKLIKGLLDPSISGDLKTPQVYLSKDRHDVDPAEGRSDHSPFHEQGYAACLASEDFFPGPSNNPGWEPNPNYHAIEDTIQNLDKEYLAKIGRLIGAAVWTKANSRVLP